jgi:DNA-binding GntR family transcriptional regulator
MATDDTRRHTDRRDADNVETVHEQLRRLVLRGELKPGETISQVALAARCGVSRTPLREALRMLQREGLITGERNRQVTVAPFSLVDLEQIYAMRVVLESAAIRYSVPQMSPEDIADLQAHIARMDHFAAAEDYERWEVPHAAFHRALVSKAGDRLALTLTELSDHAERYRRYYTEHGPRSWERGAREHKAILAAVKEADLDASAALLAAHLARTAYSVTDMIDPHYTTTLLDTVLADLGQPADGALRHAPGQAAS